MSPQADPASPVQAPSPADSWRNVRRILVVRLDNIGDVIMLGPALRALKRGLPGCHITLMASPTGSQVPPLLPWVDDVLVERATWQDISGTRPQDPERELTLVQTVRDGAFDAAFIFTSFSQSPYPPAYVCYLAGIPLRVAASREFGGALLTQWVRPLPDDAHQVDRNLHLVEQAGFAHAGRHLEIVVPRDAQTSADRMLWEAGVHADRPFVLLAPGASAAARRYDAARYAEVATTLARQGRTVVVAGSAREAELAAPILGTGQEGIVSLVGRTSLGELAGAIRRAAVVIANDSGPMHLADALRRPSVILYSGTELESQWRPRTAPARLLRRPTDCSPCYAFRCPFEMQCLDIPPAEVVAEAQALLAGTEGGPLGGAAEGQTNTHRSNAVVQIKD